MTPADLLGWASSVVLVATIAKQVHRQWSAGTSEGVSKWLFLGQLAASAGFTAYSVIVGNVVFMVTNATLAVAACAGLAILLRHRQRERTGGDGAAPPPRTARERMHARQGLLRRTRAPSRAGGITPWRASSGRGRGRYAGFDK